MEIEILSVKPNRVTFSCGDVGGLKCKIGIYYFREKKAKVYLDADSSILSKMPTGIRSILLSIISEIDSLLRDSPLENLDKRSLNTALKKLSNSDMNSNSALDSELSLDIKIKIRLDGDTTIYSKSGDLATHPSASTANLLRQLNSYMIGHMHQGDKKIKGVEK